MRFTLVLVLALVLWFTVFASPMDGGVLVEPAVARAESQPGAPSPLLVVHRCVRPPPRGRREGRAAAERLKWGKRRARKASSRMPAAPSGTVTGRWSML